MSSGPRLFRHLSAPVYFACVVLVTGLGVAGVMAIRPAFAHRVLEFTGLEAMPQATPGSFYALRVAPLFAEHCASCHGENRQKAELRLDSYAFAMRGSRRGAVIVPGNPKASELITRIALPAGDDRAMPPEGKTPLSPDEVTVMRLWIAAGASPTMKPSSIKGAPRLVAEVKFPELDPSAARQLRAPLAGEVARLSARFPGLVGYESRNSAGLELNAALGGSAFTDSDLKAFLPLRSRILRIDLSGTSVTDASAQTLAQMTSLKTLRLANTRIGDAMLSALAEIKSLKSLTITGTRATKSALAPLVKNGVEVHGDSNAD
jgi:Planctomycete cytochrome C